ncbi:hypothetical protein [Anabaena azotica]|uniref:Uncharacterized protein n=1 Tax=Anabaena azotica FACHB-119 TaxID=947527 RepID=A0ABR8DED1_9NOST|nr:hypothetical protein [Anabaena azotica]MBD2505600.1 hypothetical protein [Anabaena azotica FACHB-119]
MARRGELTVQTTDTGTSIEAQPKSIVRGKSQNITTAPSAQAVVIEELQIAFDDDLRLAILKRLIKDQQVIQEQASNEKKIAKAMEIARLETVEQAREEGKQLARAEMAQKKREQLAVTQKQFIEVELPQIIDACSCLSYETMKQTVENFASNVGITLEWKDLEDGQFECIPSITP